MCFAMVRPLTIMERWHLSFQAPEQEYYAVCERFRKGGSHIESLGGFEQSKVSAT
jgi:hypothetical protein